MTKAEEYTFQKARGRHPTFLQDLIEKEETKAKPKLVRKVKRKNDMYFPEKNIVVDVEKSTDVTPEEIIKKKIWG